MTRVSTYSAFTSGLDELQRRQQSMARAQEQLTSGKRVLRASDDPTGAARAERALAVVARADTNQRALESSRNAMNLTEAALSDASTLMQDARETIVAAGNPTYSAAERQSLANRLKDIRGQLLAIANRGDGAGGYLFSGQGTNMEPFNVGSAGVSYQGNNGEQTVASETAMPVTVDGHATWMAGRTGNGQFLARPGTPASTTAWVDAGRVSNPSALTGASYTLTVSGPNQLTVDRAAVGSTPAASFTIPFTPGTALDLDGMAFTLQGQPALGDRFVVEPSTPTLSVFDALDRAIAGLSNSGYTLAQTAQAVSDGLRDVESTMTMMQGMHSRVGSVLTAADQAENRIMDLRLYGQSERSAAEDLDMTQAISDFQTQQTGFDAALKSYAQVQRMTLFDYINGR